MSVVLSYCGWRGAPTGSAALLALALLAPVWADVGSAAVCRGTKKFVVGKKTMFRGRRASVGKMSSLVLPIRQRMAYWLGEGKGGNLGHTLALI